jgi:hypothetical protein
VSKPEKKQEKSPLKAKIAFQELLAATAVGCEGIANESTIEVRKARLSEDMDILLEVAESPCKVIDQGMKEFGRVFQAATAFKFIEQLTGKRCTVDEVRELISKNDPLIASLLSGENDGLLPYFQLIEMVNFVELVNGRKIDSGFKMSQGTAQFLQQNKERKEEALAQVQHLFQVMSAGKCSFDNASSTKSWDELIKLVSAPNYTIENNLLDQVVNEIPELRALEIIGYQKNSLYVGLPSSLIQPILVAGLFVEPEEAPKYIIESLGLTAGYDALTEAIFVAVQGIKESTVTADQLNTAGAHLGKRLLIADYDATTADRMISALRESSNLSRTKSIAETVSRSAFLIAGSLYNSAVEPIVTDRNILMTRAMQLYGTMESEVEFVTEVLSKYSLTELQGLLFLLETRDHRFLSAQMHEKVDLVLLQLLAGEVPMEQHVAQSLNEVVAAAFHKQYEDIGAIKYNVAVQDLVAACTYGLNGILYAVLMGIRTRQPDAYDREILTLEALGKLTLIRTGYLNKENIVVRAEFQQAIEAPVKGEVMMGAASVSVKAASQMLKDSAERPALEIQHCFLQNLEEMSVYDLIGSSFAITSAINAELETAIRTTILASSVGKTGKVKNSISADDYIEQLRKTGLSETQSASIYASALKTLHEANPTMFIDPKTLNPEQLSKRTKELSQFFRISADITLDTLTTRNGQGFKICTSALSYRVVESTEERDLAVTIYDCIFDPQHFTDGTTFKELYESIRKVVPKNISNKELRERILNAVTNYAVFTRHEINPAMVQLAVPSALLDANGAYEQIRAIREAALERVMATRNADAIATLPQPESVGITASIERIRVRVNGASHEVSFATQYSQSLTGIAGDVERIAEIHNLEVSEKDREIVTELGERLFPDFNKKQRRALAIAVAQKWGTVAAQNVENTVAAVRLEHNRISNLVRLSNAVTELLTQVFGDYFGVEAIRIRPLPVVDFSQLTTIEQSSKQSVLYAANQVIERDAALTAVERFQRRLIPGLSDDSVDAARAVMKIASWSNVVTITETKTEGNTELRALLQVIRLVSADEIANANSIGDVIAIGISRCIEPLSILSARNAMIAERLPIRLSVRQGGRVDYIRTLASVITRGWLDTEKLFTPDCSVVSMVAEMQPLVGDNPDAQVANLLQRAISRLQAMLRMAAVQALAAEPSVIENSVPVVEEPATQSFVALEPAAMVDLSVHPYMNTVDDGKSTKSKKKSKNKQKPEHEGEERGGKKNSAGTRRLGRYNYNNQEEEE